MAKVIAHWDYRDGLLIPHRLCGEYTYVIVQSAVWMTSMLAPRSSNTQAMSRAVDSVVSLSERKEI